MWDAISRAAGPPLWATRQQLTGIMDAQNASNRNQLHCRCHPLVFSSLRVIHLSVVCPCLLPTAALAESAALQQLRRRCRCLSMPAQHRGEEEEEQDVCALPRCVCVPGAVCGAVRGWVLHRLVPVGG